MKVNKWTLGLAAVGLVSLPTLGLAEEKGSPVMSALSSTTISGYVSTSMRWSPGQDAGPDGIRRFPAYSYNNANKQDGFNLDVVKLTIEKALDEDQWAAGYKVDLLFGQDANNLGTSSSGVNTGDFAIKQAYVALRAPVGNGLDFKVGVFDTVIGYESFDAGNNPNYTRSYGYTIEPTTHTGVLSTYQFTEWIGMAAGVADTVGPRINQKAWNQVNPRKAESYKTYMGSLILTAPESFGFLKGSTLYGGVVNGFNNTGTTTAGVAGQVQANYYVGTTIHTPITALKLGASYDYMGVSARQYPTVSAQSGYANATALYASYQVTEKLSVHGRGEYATFSPNVAIVGSGLPSKIVATTATIQYDLWKNVLSRLEVRWDHQADGAGRAYGKTQTAAPTGGLNNNAQTGSRRNSWLIAGNIIYKF